MDLAEEAGSKKKAIEYLTKALELEPDNLEASMMLIGARYKSSFQRLKPLARLIEKGDKLMEQGGYFRDNMGEFWLVHETRPYMAVRLTYLSELIDCGMMRAAATEGERLLELCVGDNNGVRYQLMHIYARLEDEEPMLKLWDKYKKPDDAMMLLPLSALYFKLNRLDVSSEYLKKLMQANKDTKKFFTAITKDKLDTIVEEVSPYGYRPGHIDELIHAFIDNDFLYLSIPNYFEWASAEMKNIEQSKAKKELKKSGDAFQSRCIGRVASNSLLNAILSNKEVIFSKIDANMLMTYCWLEENLHTRNIKTDSEYRKKFSGFYRMRFITQRYRDAYFGLFEQIKNQPNISFESVSRQLFEVDKKHEFSFISKMLHTIDPTRPIYDSQVDAALSIHRSYEPDFAKRLQTDSDILCSIIAQYQQLLCAPEMNEILEDFDRIAPSCKISTEKKLDFILWALGKRNR